MKRAATILLLLAMVSIQTPIGQLFKLPLLIEHYVKHQKQNGVTLIDFLEDHYLSNHTDGDLAEDNQLPFKTITYFSIGYAVVPPIVQTGVSAPSSIQKKIIFPVTYTPQQHSGSIFHPPRI